MRAPAGTLNAAMGLVLVASCGGGAEPAPSTRKSAPEPQSSRPAPPVPAAPSTRAPARARLAALRDRIYVRKAASFGSPEIGVYRAGQALTLRSAAPISKAGCSGGWYSVEPVGYVCRDGGTTLALDSHPLLAAKRARAGAFDSATPYHFSESLEAPLYRWLPNDAESYRWEPAFERQRQRIAGLAAARGAKDTRAERVWLERLKPADLSPAGRPIPELFDGRKVSPWSLFNTPNDTDARVRLVPAHSSIAWTEEFDASGRSWLVTSDLLLVPKDRTRRYEPSSFKGVHLDEPGHALPIAFVRGKSRPKYRPERLDVEQAAFVDTGQAWPRLSTLELTGRTRVQKSIRYYETREPDAWIRESDATLVPATPPSGFPLARGEKWIDVSIARGTLIAYRGVTPVFVTLISPGINGYAREGGEPAKGTTPTGVFRIEWKYRSATMSPDPKTMSYFLSEVPYTQYFHKPFALHAAYWHDRFGEPKSGGCVNLSPEDARFLFDWTTPALPAEWHGVRAGDERGAGTWVRIQ